MTRYVLDTNIITAIVRENDRVLKKFGQALQEGHQFLGCPIIYYEGKRGLLARDAKGQRPRFERLYNNLEWHDFNKDDWELAAALWVKRKNAGRPIEDADLFIGVFAYNRQATLITNNTKDFDLLGITLEDWSV